MGRPEDEYLKLFEKVVEVEEQMDSQVLKDFVERLITAVDDPSLHDSIHYHLEESNKNIKHVGKPTKDILANKLEEYEFQIEKLKAKLLSKNEENKNISQLNHSLQKSNKDLQIQVDKLNMIVSELNDTRRMSLEEKMLKFQMAQEIKYQNLMTKYEEMKINKELLQNKLNEVEVQNEEMEEENKSHLETLNKISDKFIKKTKFDKLMKDHLNLEREKMQIENTLYAEKGGVQVYMNKIDSLQQKNEYLKTKVQNVNLKYEQLKVKYNQTNKRLTHFEMNQSSLTQPK